MLSLGIVTSWEETWKFSRLPRKKVDRPLVPGLLQSPVLASVPQKIDLVLFSLIYGFHSGLQHSGSLCYYTGSSLGFLLQGLFNTRHYNKIT
jgi:hypothetical protein